MAKRMGHVTGSRGGIKAATPSAKKSKVNTNRVRPLAPSVIDPITVHLERHKICALCIVKTVYGAVMINLLSSEGSYIRIGLGFEKVGV